MRGDGPGRNALVTAIAGWVADVPVELLARLYGCPGGFPSKTTLWRVFTGADVAAVDAAVGAWLATQAAAWQAADAGCGADAASAPEKPGEPVLVAVAVDGKSVRGAIDSFGNQMHLLAAATHTGSLVLSQIGAARRATKSSCSPRCSTASPQPASTTRSGHHRRRATHCDVKSQCAVRR